MTPYEREFRIVVANATVYFPLDFPGRGMIHKVACTHEAGSAFTLDLYSRLFTGVAVNLHKIRSSGGGSPTCVLWCKTAPLVKVNDQIVVASSSAYNGNHLVTAITNDDSGQGVLITTATTYTGADGIGGTATPTVEAAHYAAYRVIKQLSGTANVLFPDTAVENPAVPFVNQDPRPAGSVVRRIYAKFSATGTYRLVLGIMEGIG
jgi:hypothetical protein